MSYYTCSKPTYRCADGFYSWRCEFTALEIAYETQDTATRINQRNLLTSPLPWHSSASGGLFAILCVCRESCTSTAHSTGITWLPFAARRRTHTNCTGSCCVPCWLVPRSTENEIFGHKLVAVYHASPQWHCIYISVKQTWLNLTVI